MENTALNEWVEAVARHTHPSRIHWCDGTEHERAALERAATASGTLIPLDAGAHRHSFLHRSDPGDVARTEHLTFVSTADPADAGPTNNWMRPEDAQLNVWPLFAGAMRGRTLYVVPYLMGPPRSPYSRVGVELTDSPYVVLSLRIMTRMGQAATKVLGTAPTFVRGLHSLGDLSPQRRFVVHFPARDEIWSIGSGYGGNALLSKKCHALRIASVQAKRDGWLAEHMLILGLTSPEGQTHYVTAAFPSACGKTNLAMLEPTLRGWSIDTIGDDICWMHPGTDGRLWAINPENGMFGVAPGTSPRTNSNAVRTLDHDVLFTNVALRSGRRVWWEGLSELEPREMLEDWRGNPWMQAEADTPAAHPNARFTAPLSQCPSAKGTFNLATGVPISAIIFGGRRTTTTPLVYEARDWAHGVYMGATLASETTAAATGAVGVLRHDPMAMLPFCGYHLGDYLGHWLAIGKRLTQPPRIFHVNWFRKGRDGAMLWPGYGDNIRVLKWMIERLEGRAPARESAIGLLPRETDIDCTGLELPPGRLLELLDVDPAAWLAATSSAEKFLDRLGEKLPRRLQSEHLSLVTRLRASRARQAIKSQRRARPPSAGSADACREDRGFPTIRRKR